MHLFIAFFCWVSFVGAFKGQRLGSKGLRVQRFTFFDNYNSDITELSPKPKKIAIGSVPEFALPDDSTIETSWQRVVVGSHFALLLANLALVQQEVPINPETLLAFLATTALSIVIGDLGTEPNFTSIVLS